MAGRNMLMEQAALPDEQPPMEEQQQGQGNDPVQMLMGLARQLGYQGNDIEQAMQALWDRSPTDGVGELIDSVSRATGHRPPWAGQGPAMQEQQPMMPGGGMPPMQRR